MYVCHVNFLYFLQNNFFFEIRLTETSVYRDNTEMDVIDTAANDEKAH